MTAQSTAPVDHAARVRELQNDKARQVRLDSLGKRDPSIRQLLVAHRQQAADLVAAKASLVSIAGELDAVKSQAAAEAAQLRKDLEASEAEAVKLRKDLAEALKKSKPAGGQ